MGRRCWLAVAQSFEKGDNVVNLFIRQRRTGIGCAVEGHTITHDVGLVGQGQIIGYARGAVPALRVAVAGGVKADDIAQAAKYAVVHKHLALPDIAQRGHFESTAELFDANRGWQIGGQGRATPVGPAQAQVVIGGISIGRYGFVARYAGCVVRKVGK